MSSFQIKIAKIGKGISDPYLIENTKFYIDDPIFEGIKYKLIFKRGHIFDSKQMDPDSTKKRCFDCLWELEVKTYRSPVNVYSVDVQKVELVDQCDNTPENRTSPCKVKNEDGTIDIFIEEKNLSQKINGYLPKIINDRKTTYEFAASHESYVQLHIYRTVVYDASVAPV